MIYRASAPGSLMWMGEHAVLHGKHALVSAIDQRIQVELSPRTDQAIHIDSALGQHQTHLSQIEVAQPFTFVLQTIKHFEPQLSMGFNLKIHSDFSHKIGFASSAATTVACYAALNHWLDGNNDPQAIFTECAAIIRSVQGRGSAADVAASIYGGLLYYRADPLHIEPLTTVPQFVCVYSGNKVATPTVIAQVNQQAQQQPKHYQALYQQIDQAVGQAKNALEQNDWAGFATQLKVNQQLMQQMQLSTEHIDHLIEILEKQPNILAAKISGAGLGDCVIGLGQCATSTLDLTPVAISQTGVTVEQSE